MNLGSEGATHVSGCAAECNPSAAARDIFHLQTLRFKPSSYLRDVTGARAEPARELIGSQPAVEIRRGWVLLVSKQLIERSLLSGRRFEQQCQRIELRAGIDRALIELRARQRVDMAGQWYRAAGIDLTGNPILRERGPKRRAQQYRPKTP